MLAGITLGKVGVAILHLDKALVRVVAGQGIVQLGDEGVVAHGIDAVVGIQGEIYGGGVDHQGVHPHKTHHTGGTHYGYVAETLCLVGFDLKVHTADLHFGKFATVSLGERIALVYKSKNFKFQKDKLEEEGYKQIEFLQQNLVEIFILILQLKYFKKL